ncbi:transmembrane Mn(2+) transporter [Roseiconus nitratireducens]|uniref:Transmembrane Mn(2+) transporter n=1 Tax=Roseiconus nitratireducens TaxID=2605748 RepID=A0A5M6DFC4_9BACT|nr:transmembrane Mn(2+) transporter [Roseiconus nitratireducens]
MIVAGSIVGSGELIATTKTGAEAGFSLLWLIILGCVIKVFAQIEFGRYAIISGKTTLQALDEVPGPRIRGRGNWLVWYWLLMWLASISQLGGIVGGVGQALAISAPLTQQGISYNRAADSEQLHRFESYRQASTEASDPSSPEPSSPEPSSPEPSSPEPSSPEPAGEPKLPEDPDQRIAVPPAEFDAELDRAEHINHWQSYDEQYPASDDGHALPPDTVIWSALIAVITSVILVIGRYNLIQSFSTALVASFTALVVVNVFWLQNEAEFAVSGRELFSGLVFSLPQSNGAFNPVGTALATFGIIGVGAAELITYPYWCLEKGYGKFTGPWEDTPQWKERARGWMRVMHFDAWGAMVIYTFATVAFYLLGASVLHRVGLNPEKNDMVRILAVMFRPVFSEQAAIIFLFGAFAVLYSTFFVANASHARVFSDALRVIGLIDSDEATRVRWVRILSGVFPILCLVIFVLFPSPAQLVLISGVAQGIMLPMLAGAALFFRYRRCVDGLKPNRTWDVFLWLSALAMLVTGTWTVVNRWM